MSVLEKIAWNFNDTTYETAAKFNKAIAQYNAEIREDLDSWNPGEIILKSSSVQIGYEYWVTPDHPDRKFKDEQLIDEDDDDEEEKQREVIITLRADNGNNFTALEVMYKIHERLVHRYLGDHTFFEGFSLGESQNKDIPLLYLNCGS